MDIPSVAPRMSMTFPGQGSGHLKKTLDLLLFLSCFGFGCFFAELAALVEHFRSFPPYWLVLSEFPPVAPTSQPQPFWPNGFVRGGPEPFVPSPSNVDDGPVRGDIVPYQPVKNSQSDSDLSAPQKTGDVFLVPNVPGDSPASPQNSIPPNFAPPNDTPLENIQPAPGRQPFFIPNSLPEDAPKSFGDVTVFKLGGDKIPSTSLNGGCQDCPNSQNIFLPNNDFFTNPEPRDGDTDLFDNNPKPPSSPEDLPIRPPSDSPGAPETNPSPLSPPNIPSPFIPKDASTPNDKSPFNPPSFPLAPSESESKVPSTQPAAPEAPAAPDVPTQPPAPKAPIQPDAPKVPTQPTAPEAPTQPGAPKAPTQPGAPKAPTQTSNTQPTPGRKVIRKKVKAKTGASISSSSGSSESSSVKVPSEGFRFTPPVVPQLGQNPIQPNLTGPGPVPQRSNIVQEPVDEEYLRNFPEVAAPEGADVPEDEFAAIKSQLFELKKGGK